MALLRCVILAVHGQQLSQQTFPNGMTKGKIVCSTESDYEKLRFYLDRIKALSDYNTPASNWNESHP